MGHDPAIACSQGTRFHLWNFDHSLSQLIEAECVWNFRGRLPISMDDRHFHIQIALQMWRFFPSKNRQRSDHVGMVWVYPTPPWWEDLKALMVHQMSWELENAGHSWAVSVTWDHRPCFFGGCENNVVVIQISEQTESDESVLKGRCWFAGSWATSLWHSRVPLATWQGSKVHACRR